ncbi:MAG: PEP-CTERM sorting domain-containing protein [Gemmataceae bacterium]
MNKSRRSGFAILSLAFITLLPGQAFSQTNLLSNSSFESWTGGTPSINSAITGFSGTPPVSTVLTGWRLIAPSPSTVPWTDNTASTLTNTNFGQSAGGSRAIAFNTDTGSNYLTQTVSLTNGTTYRLAFDEKMEGSGNAGNMTLVAFIAQANLTSPVALQSFSLSASATNTASMSTSWTTQSSTSDMLFTQASGSYDLTFQLTGPGVTAKDIGLDRISLIATPEPTSFVLVGSAFLGLAWRRLKNHRSAVASV